MESTDRNILKNLLAKRVGQAVRNCLDGNPCDEDIDILVSVENKSYYIDDDGRHHSGGIITVAIDFYEGDGGDEDDY